jgi:hypothetical protein
VNFIDPTGLRDWSGTVFEGGIENGYSSPLQVVDTDNWKTEWVPPGKKSSSDTDWDFVRLPEGWHKIGPGELDIGEDGKPTWGQLRHRPANEGEVREIRNKFGEEDNPCP